MYKKYLVILVIASVAAACGAPPVSPTPATPPVDHNTSGKAVLTVLTFKVHEFRTGLNGSVFGYEADLRLMEAGGVSGATLTDLQLFAPGGESDTMCDPTRVHIDPGQTWDMATLGYCAPYVTFPTAASRISFLATVTDDNKTVSTLVVTADVEK